MKLATAWKIGWNILLYASIGFVVYLLATNDYLFVPEVHDVPLFAASFPVLFLSFLASCRCWQVGARDTGASIDFAQAVASYGLPVFAKYLPGKVWVLAGRVAYMMQANPANSVTRLGAASVAVQLIDIWVAFTLSLLGFILYLPNPFLIAAVLAGWAFSLACLLYPQLQVRLFAILVKLSPRFEKLTDMPPMQFARWFGWFFIAWLLVGLAFYLMASGLVGELLPAPMLFAMPLGLIAGLLAIFVPGGIGVREAILAAALGAAGLPAAQAVTIGAASRLWFMTGEVFLFLSGVLAHWLTRRKAIAAKAHTKEKPHG